MPQGARARRMDVLQEQTFRQLQTLPGLGPDTAADLLRVGVASLDDLSRRDPAALAAAMARLDGQVRSPHVVRVLADAVHYARTGTWQAL